jgi:hypothetical protein
LYVKDDICANILSDLELSVNDDCALACGTIKAFVVALLNATALIVFAEIDDRTECILKSMSVNVKHLSRGTHRV